MVVVILLLGLGRALDFYIDWVGCALQLSLVAAEVWRHTSVLGVQFISILSVLQAGADKLLEVGRVREILARGRVPVFIIWALILLAISLNNVSQVVVA